MRDSRTAKGPCYHLASSEPRGLGLCGCGGPHPAAVTGVPGALGRPRALSARLRGHVPPPAPRPFSASGTLFCVRGRRTLPIIACFYAICSKIPKVYSGRPFLSRKTAFTAPYYKTAAKNCPPAGAGKIKGYAAGDCLWSYSVHRRVCSRFTSEYFLMIWYTPFTKRARASRQFTARTLRFLRVSDKIVAYLKDAA